MSDIADTGQQHEVFDFLSENNPEIKPGTGAAYEPPDQH
jgi:hypothetical protein